MKNYNEIYGQLCTRLMTDRENTVFEMTQNAARETTYGAPTRKQIKPRIGLVRINTARGAQ